MKSSIFWATTPRDPFKISRRFGFLLVSCLPYYSNLKMEVKYSSKALVDSLWTTRRVSLWHVFITQLIHIISVDQQLVCSI
jgi:hypothetical protein